jgi:hypothetical protein
VVVTATTGIAAQGLSQKLPEHYGTVSTIHKFVGLKTAFNCLANSMTVNDLPVPGNPVI